MARPLPAGVKPSDVRLSRAQVADLLGGVSERHVDQLIADGSLQARTIGRRVVVPLESLRDYYTATERAR